MSRYLKFKPKAENGLSAGGGVGAAGVSGMSMAGGLGMASGLTSGLRKKPKNKFAYETDEMAAQRLKNGDMGSTLLDTAAKVDPTGISAGLKITSDIASNGKSKQMQQNGYNSKLTAQDAIAGQLDVGARLGSTINSTSNLAGKNEQNGQGGLFNLANIATFGAVENISTADDKFKEGLYNKKMAQEKTMAEVQRNKDMEGNYLQQKEDMLSDKGITQAKEGVNMNTKHLGRYGMKRIEHGYSHDNKDRLVMDMEGKTHKAKHHGDGGTEVMMGDELVLAEKDEYTIHDKSGKAIAIFNKGQHKKYMDCGGTDDCIDSVMDSLPDVDEAETTKADRGTRISVTDPLDMSNKPVPVRGRQQGAPTDNYTRWMNDIGHTKDDGYNIADDGNGTDYDYKGYYEKFGNVRLGKGQHLTDEFKQPNHPLFSDESKYYNSLTHDQAGKWKEDDDNWEFTPNNSDIKSGLIERKYNEASPLINRPIMKSGEKQETTKADKGLNPFSKTRRQSAFNKYAAGQITPAGAMLRGVNVNNTNKWTQKETIDGNAYHNNAYNSNFNPDNTSTQNLRGAFQKPNIVLGERPNIPQHSIREIPNTDGIEGRQYGTGMTQKGQNDIRSMIETDKSIPYEKEMEALGTDENREKWLNGKLQTAQLNPDGTPKTAEQIATEKSVVTVTDPFKNPDGTPKTAEQIAAAEATRKAGADKSNIPYSGNYKYDKTDRFNPHKGQQVLAMGNILAGFLNKDRNKAVYEKFDPNIQAQQNRFEYRSQFGDAQGLSQAKMSAVRTANAQRGRTGNMSTNMAMNQGVNQQLGENIQGAYNQNNAIKSQNIQNQMGFTQTNHANTIGRIFRGDQDQFKLDQDQAANKAKMLQENLGVMATSHDLNNKENFDYRKGMADNENAANQYKIQTMLNSKDPLVSKQGEELLKNYRPLNAHPDESRIFLNKRKQKGRWWNNRNN